MAARRVLCRFRVEIGDTAEEVEVMTEGAGERSGCSTQLSSAWLRLPWIKCQR